MEHENLGKRLDAGFNVRTISPDDEFHYFFGYYDLNAYHPDGRRHLANRVRFMDRLPRREDVCQLGCLDVESRVFTPFAETTAWNFQQGALMTYNAADYDEVFYNVRRGEDYATCIHNLRTGQRRFTDRACACVAPNGRWGLAVNFSRIYDFRPGYGYCGVRDRWFDVKQPEDDGVYLVDMQTGRSRLLISIARMLREFPVEAFQNEKFVINHITFNPASNRFLFLLRNFMTAENPVWRTSLITSDLEGNMCNRVPSSMVSHYHWKNESQILFFGDMGGRRGIHLLDDQSGAYTTVASPLFDRDIHCLYSPDRRYFVGDGYPGEDHCRPMILYDTQTERAEVVLRDYSVAPDVIDIRCDLHNRWNVRGDRISFDSTRNGRREICEMDVSALY